MRLDPLIELDKIISVLAHVRDVNYSTDPALSPMKKQNSVSMELAYISFLVADLRRALDPDAAKEKPAGRLALGELRTEMTVEKTLDRLDLALVRVRAAAYADKTIVSGEAEYASKLLAQLRGKLGSA